MTAVGWLPAPAEELFGPDATAEESYEVLTVDVPPASWIAALQTARDDLGCTYFDWLSAVDEPGTGFRVAAHVAALSPVRRLLLRTTVPHGAPVLPTAVGVFAGAAWHERETHEMFGVTFEGHPSLNHLLLPETFEGHPLRKDFVLAARVAKAWPGAKEPGESEHGGPKRRQMLPPGVPDPNDWGPQKGQLPPAPTRTPRAAPAPGERATRRTRTATEGSASQTEESGVAGASGAAGAGAAGTSAAGPRRARTAAEGSASQTPAAPESPTGGSTPPATDATPPADTSASPEGTSESPASVADTPTADAPGADAPVAGRRARSVSEGSASQRTETGTTPVGPRRSRGASQGSASQRAATDAATPTDDTAEAGTPPPAEDTARKPATAPRSPDAPWHHARPAFEPDEPQSSPETDPQSEPESEPGRDSTRNQTPEDPAGGPQ